MRFLLDTHALFWSADDPGKLSPTALNAIQDPGNVRLLTQRRSGSWRSRLAWRNSPFHCHTGSGWKKRSQT